MLNYELVLRIKDRTSTTSWVEALVEAGLFGEAENIQSVRIDLEALGIPKITVTHIVLPGVEDAPPPDPDKSISITAEQLKADGATPEAQAAVVREGGGRYT